jgi:hypothetical protein
MNNFPAKETVKRLRKQYPQGCRVELVQMEDPFANLRPGDQGSVVFVDDAGTIFCIWDSGSTLGVVYGVDAVKRIAKEPNYE